MVATVLIPILRYRLDRSGCCSWPFRRRPFAFPFWTTSLISVVDHVVKLQTDASPSCSVGHRMASLTSFDIHSFAARLALTKTLRAVNVDRYAHYDRSSV